VRTDRERVLDALEAIDRIERYTRLGEADFRQDELVQSWVIRHLQILGEAIRGLSPELRAQHEELPWSEIVGMRNILVHDYFDVDQDIVWSVVEHDLSGLRLSLERILASLPPGHSGA
jgi:uncharacterized protein with HEPN domain